MDTVTLYLDNGSSWTYDLVSIVGTHIYIEDQLDGTSLKLDKDSNKLYSYDVYNNLWKHMKDTSKMVDRVEINQNKLNKFSGNG